MSAMAFEEQLAARPAEVYADFLLPHLERDSHLLDVGCGDGALSISLADVCGRVTAVDLDPEEYAAGAAYAASIGLDRLAFVTGDAAALAFPTTPSTRRWPTRCWSPVWIPASSSARSAGC